MRVVGFECINMGVIGLQVVLQMVQDKITEEQMYIEEKRGQRTEEFCIQRSARRNKGTAGDEKRPIIEARGKPGEGAAWEPGEDGV